MLRPQSGPASPNPLHPQQPLPDRQAGQSLHPVPNSSRHSTHHYNYSNTPARLHPSSQSQLQVVTYRETGEDTSSGCDTVGSIRSFPHKSPSRPKWSPLVHTIAEGRESFTGTVFPAKLFVSHGGTEPLTERCGMDDDECRHGLNGSSVPALEQPNGPKNHQQQAKDADEEGIAKEDTIVLIPMDTLLREIKRLAAHEFGGPWKAAPYPVELEPLYQRLYDYHVLLKSARKRAGADAPHRSHSVQASPIMTPNGAKSRLGPLVDPTSISSSNSVATLMAASAILPLSQYDDGRDNSLQQKKVDRLQDRIRDLEKQLAQSRRAHHTLLQEHLLTFAGASATSLSTAVPMSGLPLPPATTMTTPPSAAFPLRAPTTMTFTTSTTTTTTMTTTTMVMANLAQADATAIRSILASVPSSEAEELQTLEEGLPCAENILSKSQISLKESLQVSMDTLHARQQTQPQLCITKNDESSSFMSAITTTTATTATQARKAHLPCSSLSVLSPSNASLSQLVTVKDDPDLLVEGLNRLLRAETELGLLKLVMAQNQHEISGLEEEVFRKQAELRHHRQVYDYLLELNRLEYEAQIWEDRVKIQEELRRNTAGMMEGRGKGKGRLEITCGKEDVKVEDTTMNRVRDLEGQVAELQQRLGEKRAVQVKDEPEMVGRVRFLEQLVVQLREELEVQSARVAEMEQLSQKAEEAAKRDHEELERIQARLQRLVEGNDGATTMDEKLEMEHNERTTALESNLMQVQTANKQLETELSKLALKIVRVEALNEDLKERVEKERTETDDWRRQIAMLQEQLETAQSESIAPPSSVSQSGVADADTTTAAMKRRITELEIQIEELSTSLRDRERSLDHAQEETERLALQLEQDLALQRDAHAKEMKDFAEEKKLQAQRERACQAASVTLFQNMVTKLQAELSDTQEKLRDTTVCWSHTKDQLQKCEQSYRRRKKDLEETTRHLHEVEETVAKLGDAIEMLEAEKETNLKLLKALEEKDQELKDMEYRIRMLEESERQPSAVARSRIRSARLFWQRSSVPFTTKNTALHRTNAANCDITHTPLQKFRAGSSSEAIDIPTRYDPKTDAFIVLWKDIQYTFKNVERIMNGNTAVLFLTGDDFEDLKPLRIAHHPDVALTAVVASSVQDALGSPSASHVHAGDTSNSNGGQVSAMSLSRSMRDVVTSLEITGTDGEDQALVVRSQVSTAASTQRGITYPHNAPAGVSPEQRIVASAHTVDGIQSEMNYNIHRQEVHRLQQHIDSIDQKMCQQQQQMDDVQQKDHELQQQINDLLQMTRQQQQLTSDLLQKVDQQQRLIDTMTQNNQLVDLQLQQLSERIHEMNNGQKEPSSSRHQATKEHQRQQTASQSRASGCSPLSQQHVQSLLSMTSQDTTIPRLFIVLPKAVGSLEFQLFYLCECGNHTEDEAKKGTHKVHMTDHPGYDLNNPDAFFEKYGPYLLTMMYMVKHGAVAPGRAVPPLARLEPAKGIDANQDHPGSVRKDIIRLVDEVIVHLERTITIDGNGIKPGPHWMLDGTELARIPSYLKVQDGRNGSGDLHRIITRERHCVWVCNKHRCQSQDSMAQQTKGAAGGTAINPRFGRKSRIETKSLIKYGIAIAIAMVLVLEWLFTESNVFRSGTQNQDIEIRRLADIDPNKLESAHECRYRQIAIQETRQSADNSRLVNILRRCRKLEVLRIGCLAERSFDVINLVMLARESILQNGHQLSLRTFEVMEEGLQPFSQDRAHDDRDHIVSVATFNGSLKEFDMRTHVKLRKSTKIMNNGPLSKLFLHYGWSIETLSASSEFNDHLVTRLHEAIRGRGSRLAKLSVIPTSLAAPGLVALDHIIRLSPSSLYLRLDFNNLERQHQLELAIDLLKRCKERLNVLGLHGDSITHWLPQLIQDFPNKNSFPRLEVFGLGSYSRAPVSRDCVPWIISMVSASSREPSVRLKGFKLSDVSLTADDWRSVIRAMDFSALEWIDFRYTDLFQEHLDLLTNLAVSHHEASNVPLKTLFVDKDVLDKDAPDGWYAKFSRTVPHITIRGT